MRISWDWNVPCAKQLKMEPPGGSQSEAKSARQQTVQVTAATNQGSNQRGHFLLDAWLVATASLSVNTVVVCIRGSLMHGFHGSMLAFRRWFWILLHSTVGAYCGHVSALYFRLRTSAEKPYLWCAQDVLLKKTADSEDGSVSDNDNYWSGSC